MKETYTKPEISIELFETEDIMTDSGIDGGYYPRG
jgi:hypothetical protein